MLFNSIHFLFFLPIVFGLYWCVDHKYRWMVLLATSYYFYLSFNPWFGAILLLLTLISFYSGLKTGQSTEAVTRKRWLWFAIICNLACLFVFKYYAVSVNLISGYSVVESLVVPIGLSFYTLRLIGYVIDVYRGKITAEPNAAKFALFASFFPVILSGPVERFSALTPQLFSKQKLNYTLLSSAVRIATWGYFKKLVIADRLAEFVDPVFAVPQHYSGSTLLIIAFFFVIQLYADFSGYTDIVTGVSRLFGIELSINWRRPLLSRSLVYFWKRYHISLTSWFHDYVYLSIVSKSRSYLFWVINIFLVFVISGLWHGAAVTFILWGTMHGFVYIMELLLGKKIRLPKSLFFAGWIYVILFHSLSLIAFRANSLFDVGIFYKKILDFNYNFSSSIHELLTINSFFPLTVSLSLILFLFIKELNEEFRYSNKLNRLESFARPAFYVFIFLLIFVLGKFNASEFIYTHF